MQSTVYHKGAVLLGHEVFDTGVVCPICHSGGGAEKIISIQKNPEIDLLSCRRCRGRYASKMPKPEFLDLYYKKDYYADSASGFTFHDARQFADHLAKVIRINENQFKILDFGGGSGDVSSSLAMKLLAGRPVENVEVHVVDYDAAVNHPQAAGVRMQYFRNLSEINENKYNIVLASAVLEHIPALFPVIKKLFSCVRSGGYLYARTPYISPFMKLFPEINMTYPAHVHDLGGGFWNRVIETYQIDAQCLASRPSVVETGFRRHFFRTLAAHALKLPGHVETRIFKSKQKKDPFWPYIGGWEIFLRFNA